MRLTAVADLDWYKPLPEAEASHYGRLIVEVLLSGYLTWPACTLIWMGKGYNPSERTGSIKHKLKLNLYLNSRAHV